MAVTIKNLARGSLTDTDEADEGPDEGKAWVIKNIVLTNKAGDPMTVNVRLKYAETTPEYFQLAPPSLSLAAGGTVILDDEITLQHPTSGIAELVSLVAGDDDVEIDYVFNGVERDIA